MRRSPAGSDVSHAEQPDLRDRVPTAAKPVSAHIRRIFCAAAAGADYTLLSPSVRHYGYGLLSVATRWLGDQGREGRLQQAIGTPYSRSTAYLPRHVQMSRADSRTTAQTSTVTQLVTGAPMRMPAIGKAEGTISARPSALGEHAQGK